MDVYATIWSLLPPIIAIVLALITKEVYSSLFIGIIVGILPGAGVLGCPAQRHTAPLHIQRAGEIRQILPEDGSRGGRIGQVDDQLPGSAHRAEGGTDCIIGTQAVILIDSDACPCIHDGSARERIGIFHHQRSPAEQSQPAAASDAAGTGKDEATATDEHTAGLHRFRYQNSRGGGSGGGRHR